MTRMRRPWRKHLTVAFVLASVAFAVGELWNVAYGAAVAAAAFFVAMRPLFRNDLKQAAPILPAGAEWEISHAGPGSILSPDGSALAHSRVVGPRTPPAASAHDNERQDMNKDQAQGIAKDIAGKVQETAGQVIGSREQQAKGVLKQVEGKGQQALGDAKEVLEDAKK
jgi:uncharacterized protein YjbJ (UPF0337 family)